MGRIFADNVTFKDGHMVVETEGVQEIIATSDTKQFFSTAINQFFMQDDPAADNQWEQIFRVIPGTGHGELLPFRPPDVTLTVEGATGGGGNAIDTVSVGSHGIVFEEVGEGGEIKFSRVLSAEKYVKHVKYGTAIGYSSEWFQDGSMGLVEMVTEDFREAANDRMSAIHYGAITAAANAGITASTAFAAPAGGSVIAGIINLMNSVTSTMRRNKRRPTLFVIAPEQEQTTRLAMAANTKGGPPGAIQNEMTSRLSLIITEFLPAGTGYIIEPKRRLISTNRLPLSLGNFDDLLHDSHVLVGKFRRGVLVGEGQVITRVTSLPTVIDSDFDL